MMMDGRWAMDRIGLLAETRLTVRSMMKFPKMLGVPSNGYKKVKISPIGKFLSNGYQEKESDFVFGFALAFKESEEQISSQLAHYVL